MVYTNKAYVPRDVSWLKFNRRVLKQAVNNQFTLLERLNYLKISITNLNEFFSYRVPLHFEKNQKNLGDVDDKKREELLYWIRRINKRNLSLQGKIFDKLLIEFEKVGYINYLYKEISELPENEQNWLYTFFLQRVQPSLSPQLLDNYHEFSVKNFESKCIFVRLENNKKLIIPIPKSLGKIVIIPGSNKIILLEKIIIYFIDTFSFSDPVASYRVFKLTVDMSIPLNENKQQIFPLQIAKYIEQRGQQAFSRLEIDRNSQFSKIDFDEEYLVNLFNISDSVAYRSRIIIDDSLIEEFMYLVQEDYAEVTSNQNFHGETFTKKNIFERLNKQDILLHHPYDSFQSVLAFIERAAVDRHTVSIKQTLYRVSKSSKIVQSLCHAARNGKLVYVIIELKAKEDEQHNLNIAKKLQKAGCIVSYGKANYKVHSKLAIVFMKDGRRYAHVGTGNYNEKTAGLYTDLSLLTSRVHLVDELNNFFNSLSGETKFVNTPRVVTSPNNILKFLVEKIDTVIAFKKKYPERNCSITFKVNSLTNHQIVRKLYEASCSEIDIFLIVRGACSVIPKRKNMSENITVVSYVGKFLEHSRIYFFDFDGKKEYWLSSSDLMDRNLLHRYELAVCLEEKVVQNYCQEILDTYINFAKLGYMLEEDLSYRKRDNQLDIATIFINISKYRNGQLLK
ncbi:polyphosphate kinase 1 [Enterococcus faecalis 02-MB-P-10]|uniref:polyphosphate kinase 1 n=1 Tax=Enterococcus faecalis TaxID=1351 RepID=UPI000353E8BE|nr:polyphosphate kinase 1 [Enterococcus faecalis]EPH77380.1 polyphosphate kinase 1 [Enterococcus faecalis 02-MB-P-10]